MCVCVYAYIICIDIDIDSFMHGIEIDLVVSVWGLIKARFSEVWELHMPC